MAFQTVGIKQSLGFLIAWFLTYRGIDWVATSIIWDSNILGSHDITATPDKKKDNKQ